MASGDHDGGFAGKELKELMKKLSGGKDSGDEGGDEEEEEGEGEGGREVEDMDTDELKPKSKEGGQFFRFGKKNSLFIIASIITEVRVQLFILRTLRLCPVEMQ